MYSSELQSGVCRGGGASPEIVRQTVATALVEGHNLLGKYTSPSPPPPKVPQRRPTCMHGKLVYIEGTRMRTICVIPTSHDQRTALPCSSYN